MATTAKRMVAMATSQIWYTEGFNNRTKYGKWYGMDGQPWCAMFVSWVAWQAGALDIIPKHAYTPSGAEWFKKRGQWTPGAKGIRAGDIVYYTFPNGPARIHHVGIVESATTGYVVAIEGNTSLNNARDGGGVRRMVRNKMYIVGYGRPKYTPEPKKPKATPKPKPAATSAATTPRYTLTRVLKLKKKPYMRDTKTLKDVSTLQKAIGMSKKSIDGIFGPQTDKAVRTYQGRRGLRVDGEVGAKTAAKLGWVWKPTKK